MQEFIVYRFSMTLGERIRAKREALGYGLQDVADQMGITWQAVQRWESNINGPKRTSIPKLAAFLGMSVSEFVGESEKKSAIEVKSCPFTPEQRPPPDVCELMAMALEVIQSKSPYSTALTENIKAFHRAMRVESGLPPSGECKARGETG